MQGWLRAAGWLLAALVVTVLWWLDQPPESYAARHTSAPARYCLVPFGESSTSEAAKFGDQFPALLGAHTLLRWQVLNARCERAEQFAAALRRGASADLSEPQPVVGSVADTLAAQQFELAVEHEHDWDVVDLPTAEFVERLARLLGCPIDVAQLPETPAITLVGKMRHRTALTILRHRCGAHGLTFRRGRVQFYGLDDAPPQFDELWVMPGGIDGDTLRRLSKQACALGEEFQEHSYQGCLVLRSSGQRNHWISLARLAGSPCHLQTDPVADVPQDPALATVTVPAGRWTLGELVRRLSRETGLAFFAVEPGSTLFDFAEPRTGPLSEILIGGNPEYQKMVSLHRDYVEIDREGDGPPRRYDRYHPSWDAGDVRQISLALRGSGASVSGEQYPRGCFVGATREKHAEVARIFAANGRLARLTHELRWGKHADRRRLWYEALADEERLIREFALWSMPRYEAPTDGKLLLGLLQPDRVRDPGVLQYAWLLCKLHCTRAQLAEVVAAASVADVPEGLGQYRVVEWALEDRMGEVDDALAHTLATRLTLELAQKTHRPLREQDLLLAIELGQRPQSSVVRDVVLARLCSTQGVERYAREPGLYPLILEALHDDRVEQRLLAAQLLARFVASERSTGFGEQLLALFRAEIEALTDDPYLTEEAAALKRTLPVMADEP